MASVSREQISNLHDKISVKIDKQDYLPDFEKDIKSYSKKANIPGFRKGMVPAGMIKKMYGQDFYKDSVLKSVEKELHNYLEQEKLEIFGQPLPFQTEFPDLNMQDPKEYEFLFEVGRRPEIKIDLSNVRNPILYKIKVKPEQVQERVEAFQNQFGELKETEEVTSADNIIKILITQTTDDGTPVDNGFSGEQTLYVKVFSEEFQKELQGKRKEDALQTVLNKALDPKKYSGVFEDLGIDPADESKTSSPVSVKILSVNNLEKHPVNEDLFKKAYPSKEITSEEEFKNAIESEEQAQLDQVTSYYLEDQLYHLLMETPVDLPESFLKKLIAMDGKGKTQAEIDEQLPTFIKELKWSLISGQIINDQDLKVSADDIRHEIRQELGRYFGNADLDSPEYAWTESYINKMMADKEQLESRYNKIAIQKVFDWARSQVYPEEKEISQEDFEKIQKEHQHQH